MPYALGGMCQERSISSLDVNRTVMHYRAFFLYVDV